MKKFFGFLLLYLVLVIINWWILSYSFLGFMPQVVLITIIVLAVFASEVACYIFAFFCGLALDFAGNYMFGGYSLCFLASVRLMVFLKQSMDFEPLPAQMLVVFGFSFFVKILYSFLGFILVGDFIFGRLDYFLVTAFVNGLVAPFVFILVKKYYLAIG